MASTRMSATISTELIRSDGSPKLLGRLLEQGGMAAVRALDRLSRPLPVTSARADKPVVITGGAGFIGTNLADRLVREGHRVIVYDNLSRPGVEQNIEWLKATHGNAVAFELADIRDTYVLRDAVAHAGRCSTSRPRSPSRPVWWTRSPISRSTPAAPSTCWKQSAPSRSRRRWSSHRPTKSTASWPSRAGTGWSALCADLSRDPRPGIDESRPLDFYSPYGASKGGADQYVLDYRRTYDLPTAVFRMSCIYGPHQFGTEDQGWVAHFLIRALQGEFDHPLR